MAQKRICSLLLVRSFFIVILLIAGCSVLKNEMKSSGLSGQGKVKKVAVQRPRITDDVKFFRDLIQIDLDHDGEIDIVAIYCSITGVNGVKVIKVNNSQGRVIFKNLAATSNIRFKVIRGIPTIILEELSNNYRKVKRIFQWGGENFLLAENR